MTAIVGAAWQQSTNAGWSARLWQSSVVFNNKIWVLGGSSRNDVWSSLDGSSWTEVTDSADWTARRGHSSVVFENKMWVLGGGDLINNYNDAWSSSNGTSWTQATANAGWDGRYGHTSVVFDNKMWVLGGWDETYAFNDVWSSSNGSGWTQVTAPTGWSIRRYHTSVVFDNKIWVLGGLCVGNSNKNDVWFSDDGTRLGLQVTDGFCSIGLLGMSHTSIVFDNKIWVLGGAIGTGSSTTTL